ncbi:Solute carrier 8 sodium calcium exchanger member [Phytophthora pseudosyringae]|uniref:Solute carrier 8 sodium calcium exchanger member n=1 Tax=Phytophthora pseudosyringae TaxID=221518 RepID=A0A8T1WD37_9STRA|nr:Solute carrier 8 sodium calcium exchanger member [Phytophthora pseudosyringae]
MNRCGRLVQYCLILLVCSLTTAHAASNAGTFDFEAQSYTFQEDAGTVQVKIVRTGRASESVVVEYGLAKPMDATATLNKNFKLTDSVYEVIFDENQLEGYISVELINDAEYEANEYFYLEIRSVSASAAIGSTNPITTVFIADDGDAGEFNFAVPYIFCREDSGNAVVSIERSIGFSSASYVPVALKVATVLVDSNATQGGSKAFDYLEISQELTWTTDEVSKTFAVKIFNNYKYQPDSRTIKVRLLTVTGGATIGTKSDTWIYIIDDRDAGTLSFALSHYEVLENGGKVTVNVTRSGIPDATDVNTYTDGEVKVDIATYSGTIAPGKSRYDLDYDYGVVEARGCTHISPCTAKEAVAYTPIQTTTLTFADKEAWKMFDVSILNNDLFQAPDQVFKVVLQNVVGGAHLGVDYEHPCEWSWYHDEFLALEVHTDQLLDNVGTIVTIQDDGDPAVIVSKGSLSISEIGQTDTFRVRLNSQPASDVTIRLSVTAAELKLSRSYLTFSSANWKSYQTITVEAVPDDVAAGIHSSTIFITATSSDASYNTPFKTAAASTGYTLAISIYTQQWGTYDTGNADHAFPWKESDGVLTSPADKSSIKAFILDDDQPIIKVVPEVVRHQQTDNKPQDFVCVRENGHDASVQIALLTKPHANVDISFVVDADSKILIDPETIQFTSSTWRDAQNIKISAVTDSSADALKEVTYSTILINSASSGDTMYNHGNQPVGTLFVQRFPAAGVLLDSSRATVRENGGSNAIVTYDLRLRSEPMHWEPEGGDYEPFELVFGPSGDTTLVFSADSQGALGASGSLTTAGNSSLSTVSQTVKSVAVIRFDTYPTIQIETGSSQVGLAILRLFRLSGGENGGLGGIIVGVTTAEIEMSDAWNETLLETQCTDSNSKLVPDCSLTENGSLVTSLFPDTTSFEDVSGQTDGEVLVTQSKEIDPNTNVFVPSSGWVEIDVTATVNRVLAQQRDQSSSSSTISFLVYSRSVATFLYDGVDEVYFASKEHSDSSLHPQLKLIASGSVNLALSGTASQSQQGNADAAIDGKTNSDSGIAFSYAMSRTVDTYPWWQIDLNTIRRIENVDITIKKKVPVPDLLADQLPTSIWIFLSNSPFLESNNETADFLSAKGNALYSHEFKVFSRSFDGSEADTISYRWRVNGELNGKFGEDRFFADQTTSTEARYLRLQVEGENSVLLNEVEVYQQPFASSRIVVGGYMASVANARAGQNQIEFAISSMQGSEPSPCDETTRICRHELLFTSGNWRDSQQVQVQAVDDKVAIGDREVMMTHTAESLDPDYTGDSFCGGSQVNCNGGLFNGSSVKKLLILEDDESKVVLSKSEFTVTEGSNAYPNAASFYKLTDLQTRYIRCSNDPDAVVDLQTTSKAACAASFSGVSGTPWEACITNSSALPLETGSAWMMAGFESATNLSSLSLMIPALTGSKYIRQLTLWGNPKTTITGAATDVFNITKDWIEMATVQVSMKSGGPQTMTMNNLSLFNVQSILIVFDKSYDSSNRCILAPQVTVTGSKPVTFPLSVRGELASPDSVPPAVSHLSRMHLYGVPDSVSISLSSEPLADTFVSVLVESGSVDVSIFDASNASSVPNSLADLVGAKYVSGDIRQFRMPTTLRFTPENWNVAQELTFLAVDDNTYLGNRTFTLHMSSSSTDIDGFVVPSQTFDTNAILRSNVQLSAALSYSNADFVVRDHLEAVWPFHIVTKWLSASGSIQVAVIDDDLPGVTISTSEVIESESSSTTNFSVSLDSAPLQDVTVTISYEKDSSLLSASPMGLTFTRLNWYEPQWVGIYPVANDIYDAAYPFTMNYERLVSKAKQPIFLHKISSTDGAYDGLQVGTNENDRSTAYIVNQGVRVIIKDDDTGCEKEYECLNGGACLKSSAGNVCWCPSTFGMKNCSLVCERVSECAFDRLLFNIRCFESESSAVCSSTFSAKALTSVLYRMLTTQAVTGLNGQVYPKLSLRPISEALYVVNNSRTACVDGSGGCISVSVDFMRPNLDDTSITSKLFAYQEAGSLKATPMHIELMTSDPQYVESSSAMVGMWVFVGFCGAALTSAGGLFAARAIHAKTSHVKPDNDEDTRLLAVGATSPREGVTLPSPVST